MKKTLSILMSILILALSFTFLAGAAGCDCKTHTNSAEGCHCCFDCNNLDVHYITSCIKDAAVDGEYDYNKRCCNECTGLIPCNCGCDCCAPDANGGNNTGNGPILTPDQQEEVIDGFQNVLSRIREFFDKLFNAIFEFLRFDEIMGNN
ncbi:MAG: hypothetical protein IJB74_02315 [Clostridia bacterium]|nr:hypothetical protein [Clostridia bacterium]